MPLSEWTPTTKEVKLGNTSFAVAGLGADDIGSLLNVHRELIEEIAVELTMMQKKKQLSPMSGISMIVQQFSIIAAHVIQLASGEHSVPLSTIQKMPAPTMIDALVKIVELTCEDIGGPKAAWEALQGLVERAELNLPKSLVQSQLSITEESAKT